LSAWKIARIILIVASFASGVVEGLYVPGEIFQDLYHNFGILGVALLLLFPVVFFPVAMLLVIGVQFVNPFTSPKWTAPTWNSNFLNLRDPMHFFHLVAFMGVSGGVGLLACSPFVGLWVLFEGVSCLASSVSLLLGIRLCMKVFKSKYDRTDRPLDRGPLAPEKE